MQAERSKATAFTYNDLAKFRSRTLAVSIFAMFEGKPACSYVPEY